MTSMNHKDLDNAFKEDNFFQPKRSHWSTIINPKFRNTQTNHFLVTYVRNVPLENECIQMELMIGEVDPHVQNVEAGASLKLSEVQDAINRRELWASEPHQRFGT